jgi:PHP domain-containing protein
VHSHFSHDSEGTIAEIAQAAKGLGIKAVFLTDHTNPKLFVEGPEGMVDGVLFIRGEEIVARGSILALATRSSIPRELEYQAAIDEINRQGGVAAVGHLEETDGFGVDHYSAVGIYNSHTDAKKIPYLSYPGILLDAWLYLDQYPAALLIHDLVQAPVEQLAKWNKLLREREIAAISENDSHQNVRIFGLQLDPYRVSLDIHSTYLLAPPDWGRDDLVDALRKGRTFVGFTCLADPSGFAFTAREGDETAGTLGDHLVLEEGLRLRIDSPAPATLEIVKDGKPIATTRARELEVDLSAPGTYHAEVWVHIDGRELPWIISSPIYVRSRRDSP